jgi:parvulin-like peptidyl-prolyl isomerase
MAIVAIVAVGYYREFYEPPRVMAGQIREVKFTMGDLVERIRVLQGINRYNQGGFVDLSIVPFQYLQDLLFAETVRQAAPGLGLTVTDEDIDEAIKAQFYPTPPAGQEADQGQLDREFNNSYTTFLTQVRLSDREYRVLVEEQLLQVQLFQYLGRDIPDVMEQVEVEWIRLDIEGSVVPQEVRDRLDIEDFSAVAAEVGKTGGFANTEGYVGWVPPGAFPNLDPVLFGDEAKETEPLAVGAISDPVFTQDGIYIIHKISGPEERDLEDPMRFQVNRVLLDNWRNEQLSRGSQEKWLRINFDSDRYAWVADQVRLTAPRVDRAQQQNQGGLPTQGR